MRMDLTRRGDYAVRAVLHLARRHGQRCKLREIAEDMAIPPAFLPQVLSGLLREGLVRSRPGRDGGYSLARDPADITLLQVIVAATGPLASDDCVIRGGPCRWEDACAVHGAWSSAQAAMAARLDTVTFDELAATDQQLLTGPDAG